MAATRWRLKLRFTITLLVALITVSAALSLTLLNYSTMKGTMRHFTQVLLEPVATLVSEKSTSFLEPLQKSVRIVSGMVSAGAVNVAHLDEVESALFSTMTANPDFFFMEFADPAGHVVKVLRRQVDSSLLTKIITEEGPTAERTSRIYLRAPKGGRHDIVDKKLIPSDSYDARKGIWYTGALRTDGVYWTDVYIHISDRDGTPTPVIGAALALHGPKGEPLGVVSATVSLRGLSAFLTTLSLGRNGRTFVCDANCNLVGIPGIEGMLHKVGSELHLPRLPDTAYEELRFLSEHESFRSALAPGAKAESFVYEVKGKRFLCALERLRFAGAPSWLIAAVIPEEEYLGDIRRSIFKGLLLGGGLLVFLIGIGIVLARSIARPLHDIAEETRRVRNLEFSDRENRPSRFEEIAEINDAYKQLKRGLRAFEKYVPVKLVRQLLEAGDDPRLGGRIEELTILFTDIEGFTTLSESTTPQNLAEILGEYFQTMCDQLAAQGGTIDKFIGDAVMAFWNAPRPVEAHAYHAVLGALRCQEAIARLSQAKLLHTRIGVHTAQVMVGNFGSLDRFAYTVLGDGVNLASRLEGVNKQYGTDILISDSTYSQIKDRIACRKLDRIAVKGKQQATEIYEVLGEVDRVEQSRLVAARTYEEGLSAYFAGQFERAISLFQSVLDVRPEDKPSQIMLGRAKQYAASPPPAGWNGVYELKSK